MENFRKLWDIHSSPRGAGSMGLRVESARAVTGGQCPHSGLGEDFLAHRPFFYENNRSSETKVNKIDHKVQDGPSHRGLQTGR